MTPTAKITVGGAKRRVTLNATIDTGFDGDVCIPADTAVTLGLDLIDQIEVELADGSRNRELVFGGFAVFLGKKRMVEILLTEGDETLVGTNLMSDCKLAVDFRAEKVALTR